MYKYAYFIAEEAQKPRAWRDSSLRRSLSYIHDRALGMLWAVEDTYLGEFLSSIPFTTFTLPRSSNHYPDGFLNNTFSYGCEHFSLVFQGEKYSPAWLTVQGMDIYCHSGRILHDLSNDRKHGLLALSDFKDMCLALQMADVKNKYYGVLPTDKSHTPKESAFADYQRMFAEALPDGAYPDYADVRALLDKTFPADSPFRGKVRDCYFEKENCHIRLSHRPESQYRLLNDRTLQNHYIGFKKLSQKPFCEK